MKRLRDVILFILDDILLTFGAGVTLVLILCVAGSVFLFYAIYQAEVQNTQPEVHAAWQAANPTIKLSYDEWLRLYRANLLPGQSAADSDTTIVIPMPVYTR